MFLNPVLALPSFSDDVSDAQVTVIMDKLLTGHFYFLRNRGVSVFCCFLIVPQEFKPENQNLSGLFLKENRCEKIQTASPSSYSKSITKAVINTQMSLISEPERPLSYTRSWSRLGLG